MEWVEEANGSAPAVSVPVERFAYSWAFFAVFASISGTLIVLDYICITAMTRSTRTPFAARYLSVGLLLMDCMYLVLSCLYQIPALSHGNYGLLMLELITIFSYQSYITICIMSVERLVLFKWPFWYILHLTNRNLRRAALCVWIVFALLYSLMRLTCIAIHRNIELMTCKNVYSKFLGVTTILVIGTFIVCYTTIVRLIISRKIRPGSSRQWEAQGRVSCMAVCLQFRTTSATLAYIIITVFASIGLSIIAVFMPGMTMREILVSGHVVTLVSCACNPIVYVVWFKECQTELLMLLPIVNKRFAARRQKKRIQSYCIISHVSSSSSVPLK